MADLSRKQLQGLKGTITTAGRELGRMSMMVSNDLDNPEAMAIHAALSTAAIQLCLMTINEPTSIPTTDRIVDTRVVLTPATATAGIQILGWNRLVGMTLGGSIDLVQPDFYGTSVGAGTERVELFMKTAELWRDGRDAVTESDNPTWILHVRGMVWDALKVEVLMQSASDYSVFEQMTGMSILDRLTDVTAGFFWALLSREWKLSASVAYPRAFFEQFSYFPSSL
ncbi:MAG: hypothetical protein ACLP5O_07310 [Acidimicrobiales bacterium]